MTNDYEYFTHVKEKFLQIPTMDNLCEMLKEKFRKLDKQIVYLKEQNEKLKSENWKDEQLQTMERRYKEMQEDYYSGFPISKKEKDAINKWIKKHEEEKHPSSDRLFPRGGAIGGSYTYRFTPTGLGTFGEIRCSCGEIFHFQEP